MKEYVEKQCAFYRTGKTKELAFRQEMLQKLYDGIVKYEPAIYEALYADLHKSEAEAYMTEVQIVLTEIVQAKKHLSKWQKPKRVGTPIAVFPAGSYLYKEPYGNVLILAPWNYPFQLALAPLVGAIAGGNCAIVKTSKSSPHVSKIIQKMLGQIFDTQYIFCISDEYSYDDVLAQKYELIFFTGSERVGKTIMEAAARNLTPVILELGGKSPCIIEKSADIAIAAKRLAWGKYLNAGQTCVAPDYVLIDETIKEAFLEKLLTEIKNFYGDALQNPDYPHIISAHHYDRLMKLITDKKNKTGGDGNRATLCIEPTVFTQASFDDPVMQEEIFGPILPIISYQSLDEVVSILQKRAKPLALYLFTKDKKIVAQVMNAVSFGGGCINDVIMHLANHHLPFGGVGNSGMGHYHGKASFEAFTHEKSVLAGKNFLDMPFRYPPYTPENLKLVHKLTGHK